MTNTISMKKHYLLFLFLLIFAACDDKKIETNTRTATAPSTPTLSVTEVFDRQAVSHYLAKHTNIPADANRLYMKGIAAFRNDKNPSEGLQYFLESLTTHPTARAYYEYGNASMDTEDYPAAVAAFGMAEQLGFEPLGKLLYNTACAYALQDKQDEALNYLEYAIEGGYTNGDNIMKDIDLASTRGDYRFQSVYQAAMGGASDPESVLWHSFVREFPDASLPISLNEETAAQLDLDHYISYDFEKFVPEMKGEAFSRDVGKEFFYLARVSNTSQYTAVIYAIRNSMMGENAPFSYLLASFSNKGQLIDKLVLGGREDVGSPYFAGTLKPNLSMERKTYQESFEKDPKEEGYYENKVMSRDLTSTKTFTLLPDGHIKEEAKALSMR